MVGEVDDGRRRRIRPVLNLQLVGVRQGVSDPDGEPSGITLLAVRADIFQANAVRCAANGAIRHPDSLIEPLYSTMKRIGAVVRRQAISIAVDCEFGARDSIGVTANGGAQVPSTIEIFLQGVIAQDHIGRFAIPVVDFKGPKGGAERDDQGFGTSRIGQPVLLHDLTIGRHTEYGLRGRACESRPERHHRNPHDSTQTFRALHTAFFHPWRCHRDAVHNSLRSIFIVSLNTWDHNYLGPNFRASMSWCLSCSAVNAAWYSGEIEVGSFRSRFGSCLARMASSSRLYS